MKLRVMSIATVVVALSQAVGAATFTVNSTADETDLTPGDGICATAHATCTLRAAIQEANALAGADNIALPAGTFKLTIAGQDEDAAATGDLDITDDVAITGKGVGSTIIDGARLDRVFDVFNSATATFSKMTITHGEPGAAEDGGGMQNAASVTLFDVSFIGNRAGKDDGFGSGGNGGGMETDGTATLTSVTFFGNRAGDSPGFGGAGGGIENFGTATLNNVGFFGNRAGNGGDETFAGAGGGLENFGNSATMMLAGVKFVGNRAGNAGTDGDGGDGGGMENNGGTATLTDATFINNRAGKGGAYVSFGGNGGNGGGLDNFVGTVTLTGATFIGNRAGKGSSTAGFGGGMQGTGALTNVVFLRNRAGNLSGLPPNQGPGDVGDGGGFSDSGSGGSILTNVTLAFNRAGRTGSKNVENLPVASQMSGSGNTNSPTILINSIVAASGGVRSRYNCDYIVPSSENHNIDSGNSCGFTAAGDLTNTNPLLHVSTGTLRPDSPAIDAGDNGSCPPTDRHGITRPKGAACDIGAYEFSQY